MNRKIPFDYWLLFVTFSLVLIGVVMVYSSSSIYALQKYEDSYFFLKRQGLFAVIGFGLLILFLFLDYHHLFKVVYPLLGVSLVCMGLVFIPGLGHKVGGAYRWVEVAGFRFQPSEIAKAALVLYLAYSLSKKEEKVKFFTIGFLPYVGVTGVFIGFLLLQPDFGATLVISFLVFLMLFAAGTRLSYILTALMVAAPSIWFLIKSAPYRQKRILAFLNPWDDPANTGFQIIQSFLAFHSGKIFGRGLGDGIQKLFYLPEAHTDFIFSVIGEEMGLMGAFMVIILFGLFLYRGIRISLRAPDLFGMYLAMGITTLIGFQAMTNMAVVMGLLPTKGLALPFVSYGGTSLIVNLTAMGILLNISAQGHELSRSVYT